MARPDWMGDFVFDKKQSADLKLELWLANSGSAALFSFLVLYLKEVGMDELQIALLSIAFSLSMILSNAFFGRLVDSFGPRLFLVLGLFFSSLAVASYLLVDTFQGLFLIRIIHGIALGMYPASITAIASDRQSKLGGLSAFGSLGWATGSIVAGFLAQYQGLKSMFVLSFFLFFTSSILSAVLHSGQDFEKKLKEEQAKPVKQTLQHNWKIYLMVTVRHGTANSIWIYWALFLKSNIGLTTSQIGFIQLTNTLTQFFVMGLVGDKINAKLMFVVGNILSGITFFLFTLASNFHEMILTQVLLGISWAFLFVGGLRVVEANGVKFNGVGTSTGFYNASLSLAQVIGPMLALWFFQLSGDYTFSMKMASLLTLSGISIFGIDALRTQRFAQESVAVQ